jgi:hypothetical protein
VDNENHLTVVNWNSEHGLRLASDRQCTRFVACTDDYSKLALQCDEFVIVSPLQLPDWPSLHALQRSLMPEYILAITLIENRLALLCDWPLLHRHSALFTPAELTLPA